jgi:tetratricopeptide (TPR) repeat protein
MISFLSLFLINTAFAQPELVSIDGDSIKRKPWRLSDKMGYIDMVELDGLVEVPLYREYQTFFDVYIEVSTQDPNEAKDSEEDEEDAEESKPVYFLLDLSSDIIAVDDNFVQENGLEVKTANKKLIPLTAEYNLGGEIKYVEIPKLHIGAMTLHNVTAYVTSSDSSLNINVKGPTLGLGSLNAAYAILQSQGVVQFMPKNDGKELLSNVSKDHIRYNSADWKVITAGKKNKDKIERIQISNNIIVDIETLEQQKFSVWLNNTIKGNQLFTISDAAQYGTHGNSYYANVPSTWSSIQFGTTKIPDNWIYVFNEPFATNYLQFEGVLGTDSLSFLDIAVSPIDSLMAIDNIDEYKVSILENRKLKELRKEVKNMDDVDEGSASSLAALEQAVGSSNAAEKNLLIALEKNPNNCDLYLELGEISIELEKFSDAEKHLQKASQMYHDWWDRSLDERLVISKTQAELMEVAESEEEKDEIKAGGWIYEQSDSCRAADALLPVASFFNGKNKDIFSSNYYKNLDLDDKLARITGNYALLHGNHQLANEAYRQAILLEPSPNPLNRLGLALYLSDIGNWNNAKPLFEEAIFIDHMDFLSVILYVENLRKNEGDEAVLSMLESQIKRIPSHSALLAIHVRELQKQGLDTKDAIARADAHFAHNFMRGYKDRELACYALYLLTLDRIDEAQSVLSDESNSQYAYILAQAQLYKLLGEEDQAIKHLEKAKRQGYTHPGFVLLRE